MKENIQQTYKGILILHIAMVMGPVLLAGVSYFINNISSSPIAGGMEDMSKNFQYIAYGLTILGYLGGMYLFNSSMQKARKEEGLLKKLVAFRAGNIIQTSLLEGPALVSLAFYLLTNASVFLLIGGMLILYMLLKLPVVSKIAEDLELSNEEKKELTEATSS